MILKAILLDFLIAAYSLKVQGSASLGYQFVELDVGNPPQKQSFLMDTGSSVTFIPCEPYKYRHKINHIFDPEKSSSFKKLDQSLYVRYLEGSFVSGYYAEDEIQGTKKKFGCVEDSGGLIKDQKVNGLIALGMDGFQDQFTFCLGREDGWLDLTNHESSSYFSKQVWEDQSLEKGQIQTQPFLNRWGVNLQNVKLGDLEIEGDWQAAYIDSGNTFLHLNIKDFQSFKKYIQDSVEQTLKDQYQGNDCWLIKKETDFNSFPKLEFKINDQIYIISNGDYMFKSPYNINTFCLGIHSHEQFINQVLAMFLDQPLQEIML